MLRAPPAGFERVELVLLEVDPAVLLRLAFRTRASQLGFRATAEFRFDAPKGEFGVLYAAFDLSTAFAEAVLRTVPQDVAPGEEPLLTYEELARRRVVQLAAVPGGRPLRLVKLYDEGLAAAKVDNRIATMITTCRRAVGRRHSTIIQRRSMASRTCRGSWVHVGRWRCSIEARH